MKAKRRKTLRERADAFAEWNREYVEYDSEGYRRVHKTDEFANDAGVWMTGFLAGRRARKP